MILRHCLWVSALAPLFCGHFTILKYFGLSMYQLDLHDGIRIHQVFHVSHLKEVIGSNDNTITTESLVTSKDSPSKPHVLGKNVNVKTKHLFTF